MRLTEKEAKLFFRRAQRRFKVCDEFIQRNMTAMLKFIQYAITPRIVLKRKLIRKRNRVFLRHNYLRKLLFDPTKFKKRRQAKRLHSQWSKRLVLHLRRFEVIEFVEEEDQEKEKQKEEEEEDNTVKTALSPKEVSEQLKQQLELLKCRKRTVPLFEDLNNLKQAENSQNSARVPSTDAISTNESLPPVACTDVANLEENVTIPKVPLLTAIHISEEEFKGSDNQRTEKRNGSFLDMLISKVKHTSDENSPNETSPVLETSMEPPRPHNKILEKETTETEERENSNSSSDFFGFEDNERVLGNFPGMLSTPFVRKRESNSAFVSETLNAYMRDNSLESSAAVNYPQHRPEDGQVLPKSIPPKLDMPALPEGLQGLRTVAERRSFLQRTKNTKYCIINNIGTIFRELQKRSKGHRIYKQAVESVINSSSVPMTRQGWKAATWLLTEIGNYCCQTITVDGEDVRLYGGRGNFRNKFRKPHSSLCMKSISICPANCTDRVAFRSLRPVRIPEKRSKLNDSSKKVLYKPCPLSHKILQHSRDEESDFGSLGIVRMPQVELEVFPQLNKPLSEIAKKYLQLILPYGEITREWAEFSVSTLFDSQNMENASKPTKSYTFKLPYANDRNHLIIRRVYKRSEEFESEFDYNCLSFRREIDLKPVDEEPLDSLSVECADILTDMINSVAIACSENSFIRDDPDNIYQYGVDDEDVMEEKSVRKTELHPQHAGISNKKQSRLLNELKRLNATVIDAATTKSSEGGTDCDKEYCKLGCICSSLSEGPTVRQHCGKQRCVLECKCKNPNVLRLETDGRKITTEDAFMLRRQATAKLARVEKEFTSTIVLTGSETLLINESQYDKKRRCTKIPKRYGDFVDHDDNDSIDSKTSTKRTETTVTFPTEPVLVNETIYNHLKHSSVRLKKLNDVKDLAPWCMIHMVYKCFCKGQSTIGHPIVIEKHINTQEPLEATIIDEPLVVKNRTLYSFEKEECNRNVETCTDLECDTYVSSASSEASESVSDFSPSTEDKTKIEKRGRISDNHYIEVYMNAKANHCRRVVPIPRNIYKRRNKKRVAHIQLYIAENESDETRLSLNEHVLRSVYYHKDYNVPKIKTVSEVKEELQLKKENISHIEKTNEIDSRIKEHKLFTKESDNTSPVPIKKRRMSVFQADKGTSLLLVNQHKESLKQEEGLSNDHKTKASPKFIPAHVEQITVPKISQIFSLNTGTTENSAGPVSLPVPMAVPTPEIEPTSAIDIAQSSSEDMALAHGISSDAFKNVFKQVIKNMNNLVSKKMQDIDMALRRESKAIPAPNAEILCIIRWNNFLEAYLEGFVYLWEVRTTNITFIAATIKPIMPLVINALSVINIQAILRDKLPLLGRMLMDRKRSTSSEGLAVVMQGQKMYWIVKGFLRPDKTRICPKPTPESHPLLTRKINVLCRLLINNQFNEHKKRQDALQTHHIPTSSQLPSNSINDITEKEPRTSDLNISFEPKTPTTSNSSLCPEVSSDQNNISLKLKVLPMQRNISDQATSILEQMVSQAYGFVRTNISFRKIRNTELCEIFPPAKMNSNHHWLVLDISNDFSHIFIPELKDLLTLDRIQKVMAYALAKNRIVKMQFNQKSLFNAYVTPKSQKKIYFGPYRHSITAPKLVLLQSVDGQMMLREVYESRHNIIPKTFSTTAFWVVQKSGKIYLDVEQVIEQDPKDTNHISSCDANTQQICVEDTQKGTPNISANRNVQLIGEKSNQSLESFQVQQNNQIENIGEVLSNVKDPQSNLLTERLSGVQSVPGLEKGKQDTSNTNNYIDDDDDCMIVDDEVCAPSVAVVPPNTSQSPAFASPVVSTAVTSVDSQEINTARINYTISCGGENSPLMVIQNECNRELTVLPDGISNTFTILSEAQPPSVNLQKSEEPNLLKNANQPIPINTIFNLSSENCRPLSLQTANDVINPGEIILTFPTHDANTNLSIPAQHLANFSIAPSDSKLNDSSSSNTLSSVTQSESNKDTFESQRRSLQLNEVPMKLNKNITIKKIMTEVERSPSTSAPFSYSRKSFPLLSQKPVSMTTNFNPRNLLPVQKQKPIYPRPPQLVQAPQRTNFQPNTSQFYRLPTKPSASIQIKQRPAVGNIVKSQPNFQQRTQGGLIVRSPSAINTTLRSQRPNSIRNPGFNTCVVRPAPNLISSGIRLRAPNATTQVTRLVSPIPVGNISMTKRMPNTNQQVNSLQNAAKKIQSTTIPKIPIPDFTKNSQLDPLRIFEESTKNASNNLKQSNLTNGIQSVNHTAKQNQIQSPPTNVISPVGIKRNSLGAPIRPQFRLQPAQKFAPKPVSANGRGDPLAVKLSSQVKGIPIELPRLKKFAIMSSPTQNVIPPAKAEISCKKGSEPSTISSPGSLDDSIPKKLIKTNSSIPTTTTTNTLVSSSGSKTTTSSSNANAEYGYFHANLDGLPKFVVKRVGDDFLIKVPNFNGILKLTGLSTVHNYLNQYTTQKCGKTIDEIADLKWTFKAQDRSKLNIVNKSISPLTKPINKMSKKIIATKQSLNEHTSSISTTPASILNTMKQQNAARKQLEPGESIDLSDDD
ncbi:uncharacterized protein LOC129949293 isoform X1 [Eupeodes corollae]|uniref:uncharacterized protein LOC129949293 isoform X1 n=1 Tax=Eupeodes corollae TaxID=290404 RepID=UPI00249254CE|nr:uncharacterized protein LOC129949293 isoform X1 [Eupeodes corollae]XP_055916638.1 uncharacterized protein LOC129949293 isoform X1 [Eupeodes corollae]